MTNTTATTTKKSTAATRKAARAALFTKHNQVLESYALGTGATKNAALFAAARVFALWLQDTATPTAAAHLTGLAAQLLGNSQITFVGVPSLANMAVWSAQLDTLRTAVLAQRVKSKTLLQPSVGFCFDRIAAVATVIEIVLERHAQAAVLNAAANKPTTTTTTTTTA